MGASWILSLLKGRIHITDQKSNDAQILERLFYTVKVLKKTIAPNLDGAIVLQCIGLWLSS
jgi:hypothetical protein